MRPRRRGQAIVVRMRFRSKLILTFLLFASLLAGAVLWMVYEEVGQLPEEVTRGTLVASAGNAAMHLDAEQIRRLETVLDQALDQARRQDPHLPFEFSDAGKAYLQTPAYQALLETLIAIDRNPPHLGEQRRDRQPYRTQYHRVERPGGWEKYVLILVHTGRPDRARILASLDAMNVGQEIDLAPYPAVSAAWDGLAADDHLAERFGRTCMGAWAPVRDQSGRPVALLGVEIPGRFVRDISRNILRISGVIFIGAVVFSILPAIYLSWRLNRPIKQLLAGMDAVRNGRVDAKLPILKTGDEMQSLMQTYNQMIDGLAERNALLDALAVANEIQQHLLPQETPAKPGWDIHGGIEYCDQTGGDYYDFLEWDNQTGRFLSVLIGDVTGHGIGAALLMASTRAVLRSHAPRWGSDLQGLFVDINDQLVRDTGEERFVTLFMGLLDLNAASLRYASAGHDPVLLYRAADASVAFLHNTGIPLGILDDAPYLQSEPIALLPGDVLLLSTDGVREAKDPADQEFGSHRLAETLKMLADRSAEEIHRGVLDTVRDFRAGRSQDDDVTLVVVKYTDRT